MSVRLGLLGLGVLLSGCSLSGSIFYQMPVPVMHTTAQATATVSGASGIQTTAAGYTVQSFVGEAYTSAAQTTAGGYTVNSGLAGQVTTQ